MVLQLAHHGADVNLPDDSGQTALHYAVTRGDRLLYLAVRASAADVVRLLVTAGANTHAINPAGEQVILLARESEDLRIRQAIAQPRNPGALQSHIDRMPKPAPQAQPVREVELVFRQKQPPKWTSSPYHTIEYRDGKPRRKYLSRPPKQ